MNTSVPCITGCSIPGKHSPTTNHPGDCPGCLPRPAAPDRLVCWRCCNRAEDALTRAPDLVAHIRDQVIPGSSGPADDLPGGPRSRAPAPLSLTAVADADDLHALLCSWADLVVDEHPDHIHDPGWRGTHRPGVNGQRRAVGLTTAGSWHDTARVTRWLYDHLSWSLAQPWAADYVWEVTSTVDRLRARWPIEEQPRWLGQPCPVCRAPSLARYAPTVWLGPVTITCTSCGLVVPEREFGAYVHIVAQERRDARRKSRVTT